MTSQDVILGILMDGNYSGYEIKHKFETLFSYFYNASYGTIYPTLSKMEKQGLITKESIQQESKPNKNVYTITEAGREAFMHYMESDLQDVELKSDFMVRLFFGEWMEPEYVIQWLEKSIAKEEQQIKKLSVDYERWKSTMSPTQEICITLGIAVQESNLRILVDGLQKLKAPL
ncbi:PadR family transcriptional regulator [Paenibacillus baekrokdamisoli]|uniref:PadR family transcriptional regulator n=1 Tax=Paenibacillus baekrokdamisoli TaxID=1712516 RepID=A0A3G9J0P4_9BACL|nr:PadR family transcriptional regulator [Paenibacillus baekrokdamisoli]MBB3073168.1 DNA-binding PadR family transcriptional regulator [Paenibacillus baekrokdamisoli]BBH24326.1 PadR family transcriptional regulator [Paenibacillus baekrokdamisoli]